MVPDVLAGPGSRAARLGVHGKRVARRARGLEGTLVDRDRMTISALDADDSCTTELWVAGPAALLVAKVTKISERLGRSRVVDKDVLDTLRLLRATTTTDLAHRLSELRQHDLSSDVTNHAIAQLDPLFGTETAPGVAMIVRAASEDDSPSTLAASTIVLTGDLIRALQR